jgi:hypothetical protein
MRGVARRRALSLLVLALLAVVLFPREVRGTVEEQRARLPPAADCADTVEGTWLGLRYTDWRGEWYEYTLNVRRAAPGSVDLVGEDYSHFWRGNPSDSHPPACRPGGMELVVKMPNAKGKLDGLALSFGASTWSMDREVCGSLHGKYYPDNFSGTIDTTINEFQSVNNDGGSAINEPVVFRRVRCFDKQQPAAPMGPVIPPAYEPPKRGIHCGK